MSSINPLTAKYATAAKQYQDAYNKYMGNAGLKNATDYAQKTALENANVSALASAQGAGTQASMQARNAGLTKAQSAMLGANAGAGQYSSQFGNAYNNLYAQGLNSALQNNQSTASLAQTNLKTAQQEGQAEYDRARGNIDVINQVVGATGEAIAGN